MARGEKDFMGTRDPEFTTYSRPVATRVVEDGEEVYLRELDPDTDNVCWVVCAKGDPGATRFVSEVLK